MSEERRAHWLDADSYMVILWSYRDEEHMPRKIRQLRADLRRAEFKLTDRGKGSHEVWEHPDVPDASVTLSGHDGDDAKFYQERDVRRVIAFVRGRLKKA